ncbi:ABC transporter ATP-binding protein [Anoxynatronum buryatiense]|uniref:Nickel import system ATP-binding protein NikD n=1 Tax=Anoxynatronum buryatiense TaxID=489973 RepID=A0AA45WT14_9CLOT|nr:ABC transporter ATP-binding protein [Anoxynatronum buryatiense]SMP40255.1 peptide/nickel transport system ATP-binding protein [Anoxynatronum buryatiense]
MIHIQELSIQYNTPTGQVTALDHLTLSLGPHENWGVAGESGSGKTSLALSLLGLIEPPHQVTGKIQTAWGDLNNFSSNELKRWRWREMALVFQNALEVLNPVMPVGRQVTEPLRESQGISSREVAAEARRLLSLVGLETHWESAYPHQLSGGMRQRVLLAMALACEPKWLVLDEPTSSLDSLSHQAYLNTLQELQQSLGFAMMLISHDLTVIRQMTDQTLILYGGRGVEQAPTASLFRSPSHPYTAGLFNAATDLFPYKDLWGIPERVEKEVTDSCGEAGVSDEVYGSDHSGCLFFKRCTQSRISCREKPPMLQMIEEQHLVACHQGGLQKVLVGRQLSKSYQMGSRKIDALHPTSLYLRHGETTALVGPSGSGKSTLAGLLAGWISADNGEIIFQGEPLKGREAARREQGIQLVLQDPFSALSHRLTVRQAVLEPLKINGIGSRDTQEKRLVDAMKALGLRADESFLNRYCSSLSGGQCQRVAIARSLVMRPRVLIADEITAMLDVSTQANMLRLLKGLQNSQGFTLLLVTHDLNLARKCADRIWVLSQGNLVEEGTAHEVLVES